MAFKIALLCLTVLLGSNAFPLEGRDQDVSEFFENGDSGARIIGGTNAGNVPFMVALTTGTATRTFLCGGSIVTNRHVLTAAHCMVPIGGNRPQANARGIVGTNRWAQGGVAHPFSRGIMHPQYNANTLKSDIGILITQNNIALSASVARLTVNYDFAGAGVASRVTGWGRTVLGGPPAPALNQLRPSVVDGNRCVSEVARVAASLNMRVPRVDPALEICTFLAAGRGTCHGDSGSPLTRSDRNQQIGVVSWGIPCARGAPDMFVRVSAFRAWIQNNTR